MVETHGLSHISLAVDDPQRSLEYPDGYEIEMWFE